MGIKTVLHPPYSPDVAPCDFWLFPKLRGCRYETIEEMKEAVTKIIDTLTQEDTKQSDGETSVILGLQGMWSTPSLPSLPGPLWPGVVVLDRVLHIGQIELNCYDAQLNCLKLTIFTLNCVNVYLC